MLTRRGKKAWTDLEQRSDSLARQLVEPLSDRLRDELTAALARAEILVRAATVRFDVVDPASPDAQQSVLRYFEELDRRFPGGFDPGDALVVDAPTMRAPDGSFVVARTDGAAIACGGVKRIDDDTAEIKRMWVHAEFRGAGIGRRMLERLEHEARALGKRRVVLDTNPTLVEAIAMYERQGYTPTERYNDNPYAGRWFVKAL
jgi:GNAT superfamily N-acetyltransferase